MKAIVIEPNKDLVWKEVETEHAISVRGVYSDTSKKKCYEYKKKVGGC